MAADPRGFGLQGPGLAEALLPGSSPQLCWLCPQMTAAPLWQGHQQLAWPCSLGDLRLPLLRQHRGHRRLLLREHLGFQRPQSFGTRAGVPGKPRNAACRAVSGCRWAHRGLSWWPWRPAGGFPVAPNLTRLFPVHHCHHALPPSCFLENTVGMAGRRAGVRPEA